MHIQSFTDPREYRDFVFPFLLQKEAENCLGLGIVDALINRPGTYPKAYLWAMVDGGRVVGAAWMTPPHPIGLTEMPDEALGLLVETAAQLPSKVGSVTGPRIQSNLFRDRWATLKQVGVKATMEEKLYELTQVVIPRGVQGDLRVAEPQDTPLIQAWSEKFVHDCRLDYDLQTVREQSAEGVRAGTRYLWMVENEPVAMAAVTGSTPSGIRVSWVYTPNELRGKGFGSAVVAALSQKMLAEGKKHCFLYTDASNPITNSIYQKIGYRPICDCVFHAFLL